MHVSTKFDGGKVINLSQSGLWEYSSINGAGLQHKWAKSRDLWHEADNTFFSNKDFRDSSQQHAKKASSEKERKGKDSIKQQR